MRSRPWTLICTACFLFASALVLQQCGQAAPTGEEGDAPGFKVVATTDQVMDAIIIPNGWEHSGSFDDDEECLIFTVAYPHRPDYGPEDQAPAPAGFDVSGTKK